MCASSKLKHNVIRYESVHLQTGRENQGCETADGGIGTSLFTGTEHDTRARSRIVPRVPRRGRGRTRSPCPTWAAPAPRTAPAPSAL